MKPLIATLLSVFFVQASFAETCQTRQSSCFSFQNASAYTYTISCKHRSYTHPFEVSAGPHSTQFTLFDESLSDSMGAPESGTLNCTLYNANGETHLFSFYNPTVGSATYFSTDTVGKTLEFSIYDAYDRKTVSRQKISW